MLYALSVGAREPELTYEGAGLRVLPTFAASLLYPAVEAALAAADWTRVLFGSQSLVLHGPLPVAGDAEVRARVSGVHDQGSGGLVTTTAELVLGGSVLATSRAAMFVRGAGGFGGERAPSSPHAVPGREPDVVLAAPTRPEQALLYRLNGDRNPLHADPAYAARGGFAAPILHGLCTLGIAARLLASAPVAIEGRFTAPVVPGEGLAVEGWRTPGRTDFRVRGEDGRVVLDRGVLRAPDPA